jgi:tetratricopeptide (TPR) repeat protein
MLKITRLSKLLAGLLAVACLSLGATEARATWFRFGCGPFGCGVAGGFGWGGWGGYGYGYRSYAFGPGWGCGPLYRPLCAPWGFYRPYPYLGYSSFYSYPSYGGYAPLAYGGVWSYGPRFGFNPVFLPNEAKPAVDAEFLPLDKPAQANLPKVDFDRPVAAAKPAAVRAVISSSPLDRGIAALESGNYGQASRDLQKAVAMEPRSVKSRWLLAQSLWLTGKYTDAAAQARRVLDDPTVDSAKLAQESRFLTQSPFWETGLTRLRQARAAFPADKNLMLLEAVALQADGQNQKAGPLWRELATDPADQFAARRMLARNP